MRVYLHGLAAAKAPTHRLHVCPAGDRDIIGSGEVPSEWVYPENGEPVLFTVEFKYGEADVPQHLGRYMVKAKYAKSSKLILPGEVAA